MEFELFKESKTILLLCFLFFSLSAIGDQNLENEKTVLRASLAYLIQGNKLDELRPLTNKFLQKYPNELEVLRLDGIALYLNEQYQHSAEVFENAANRTLAEDKIINFYLLAQSFIKLKKYNEAKGVLVKIGEISGGEEYSRLALKDLEANQKISELNISSLVSRPLKKEYDKPTKTNQKESGLNISFTFGHDSNPVFVPDTSSARSSFGSTVMSFESSAIKKINIKNETLENDFNFTLIRFSEESAEDLNHIRLGANTKWDPTFSFFKQNNLSLDNNFLVSFNTNEKFDYYFLNDQIRIKKNGLVIKENQFIPYLSLKPQLYNNEDLADDIDNKNGLALGIGLLHSIKDKNWAILNAILFEKLKTSGEKYNASTFGGISNLIFNLPYEFQFQGNVGYMSVSYPDFGEKRTDNAFAWGLDIQRRVPWGENINAKISFSNTKNRSTLTEFTYTQQVVSLRIGYDVF